MGPPDTSTSRNPARCSERSLRRHPRFLILHTSVCLCGLRVVQSTIQPAPRRPRRSSLSCRIASVHPSCSTPSRGTARSISTARFCGRGTGGRSHRTAKTNPLPFGDMFPTRWFFRLLAPNLVDLIQREYAPGTRPPVITIGTTTAGLAICFDVIYDSVVWDAARRGAELYLLQSNNADFRGTEENQQQSAIVRMGAIETGRSVVNVSTVGESQVYDSSGESVASIAANTAGALVTDVQLRRGLTPAVAVGGTVEGVTVWGSLVVLVMSVWYRREPRQNRRP